MKSLQGIGVSRGVAVGKLQFFRRAQLCIQRLPVQDTAAEVRRFAEACTQAQADLGLLYTQTLAQLGAENAEVFQIHQMILDDPDLREGVAGMIEAEAVCAEYALEQTAATFAAAFAAMDDPYMQGRTADVQDVAGRVLRWLCGVQEEGPSTAEPFILAADDLVPSETARLDRSQVLAFVTCGGSNNSHTAIFARTMGIPAITCLGPTLLEQPEGVLAGVDGHTGLLLLEPDAESLARLQAAKQAETACKQAEELFRGRETRSKTGRRVQLFANAGCLADIDLALAGDAEGIGLFRSEFLYLERDDYPSEETQYVTYRAVLEKMQGRPVVIRTLDIGADKQAGYFGLAAEENPAMGLRAVRLCLQRPEIFRTQLRALYRASAHGPLSIMVPMITCTEELRQCKALAAEVRSQLKNEGQAFCETVPIGVMIETPAAALLSEELAQEANFFSVGTNDLTQYTLALDRQNCAVAPFADPAHKAVLRLIAMAAESAHKAGIWIGICGELGADTRFTEAFLAMGINELSVVPSAVLPLRAKIAQL